jgi:hypothetical protein
VGRMPLRMRLGWGFLGFSGPSISSNAMLIPIPKGFCHWWHWLYSLCGRRIVPASPPVRGLWSYFNPSPDILAENFPFGSPLLPMGAPIFPRTPETHSSGPWGKGEKSRSPYFSGIISVRLGRQPGRSSLSE